MRSFRKMKKNIFVFLSVVTVIFAGRKIGDFNLTNYFNEIKTYTESDIVKNIDIVSYLTVTL